MDKNTNKIEAAKRPAVDWIDALFSRIENLPSTPKWVLIIAVFALFATSFVIAMIASLAFIFPIWLYLLATSPQWLLPLLLTGPVWFAVLTYLFIRFILWRERELRPWSNRRLSKKIAREFGGLMICGHIAFAALVLVRAGYPVLAFIPFAIALGLLLYSFNWFMWLFGAYAPRQIEETLFPEPTSPAAVAVDQASTGPLTETQKLERKNGRILIWVLLIFFFLPLAVLIFVNFLFAK